MLTSKKSLPNPRSHGIIVWDFTFKSVVRFKLIFHVVGEEWVKLGFVFLYEPHVEMHLLSSEMICSSRLEPSATEVGLPGEFHCQRILASHGVAKIRT